MQTTPNIVSITDACALLTVSRSTFYRLVKTGRIRTVAVSARRRAVVLASIEEHLGRSNTHTESKPDLHYTTYNVAVA